MVSTPMSLMGTGLAGAALLKRTWARSTPAALNQGVSACCNWSLVMSTADPHRHVPMCPGQFQSPVLAMSRLGTLASAMAR
eukprot:9133975-Pyramimonas_sp.AAC.1